MVKKLSDALLHPLLGHFNSITGDKDFQGLFIDTIKIFADVDLTPN